MNTLSTWYHALLDWLNSPLRSDYDDLLHLDAHLRRDIGMETHAARRFN